MRRSSCTTRPARCRRFETPYSPSVKWASSSWARVRPKRRKSMLRCWSQLTTWRPSDKRFISSSKTHIKVLRFHLWSSPRPLVEPISADFDIYDLFIFVFMWFVVCAYLNFQMIKCPKCLMLVDGAYRSDYRMMSVFNLKVVHFLLNICFLFVGNTQMDLLLFGQLLSWLDLVHQSVSHSSMFN